MNKILKGELESYLKKILSKEKPKSILIITGKNSYKKSEAEVFFNQISLKHTTTFYRKVEKNPYYTEILSFLKSHEEYSFDIIIAYGGGAVIDFSKLVALFKNNISVFTTDFQSSDDLLDTIPIIAIPTTAGSGSEVTKGSIITDVKRKLKLGIRGDDIFPKEAIIDPELTISCPENVTVQTGFDTFSHIFESYVAKKSSIITDRYAEEALLIIKEFLPKCLANRLDIKAREKMSYAALLGGVCVANASTCLPHRLQQAMGGVIDVAHGKGLAILYKSWFKIAYPFKINKFDKFLNILDIDGTPNSVLENFMKKIKMDFKLSDIGAKKSNIDQFIDRVNGNIDNDPIDNIDTELMRKIYLESF